MKTIICLLIGHKESKITDGGYNHCERCKLHEYWDKNYNKCGYLLLIFYFIRLKIYLLRSNYNLKFRNKLPF